MNSRVIKSILKGKHEDFLASIDNPEIKKIIDDNAIITGGSIASMLLNEPISDFDYYFKTKEAVLAIANYYVDKFNEAHPNVSIKPKVVELNDRVKIWVQSAGIVSETSENADYRYFEGYPDEVGMNYIDSVMQADEVDSAPLEELEKGKYRPVFMSANAITLSNKVQLVMRFYGDPAEIHKNYDFVHCCNYWTSSNNVLVLNPAALESLLCKHLQYQGSLYPICSVIRTRKFLKKGWYINAGQYLKMCFQIAELDLKNMDVLEEQLTGVDAAYFHQLLSYCRDRQEKDPSFVVTAPYIVSVIDKLFG